MTNMKNAEVFLEKNRVNMPSESNSIKEYQISEETENYGFDYVEYDEEDDSDCF